MNKALGNLALVLIASIALVSATKGQIAARSKDLPNFYRVNAILYRGGQPTEPGIRELKQMGVNTIIDLRDKDVRAQKEEEWAKTSGLQFINIPLGNWSRPSDVVIESILKHIDLPSNQPIFIHCKRGSDRTGTAIAVYRITHNGWTAKQANEEAKRFGFGWWQLRMKDYINDYYRDFKLKTPSLSKTDRGRN